MQFLKFLLVLCALVSVALALALPPLDIRAAVKGSASSKGRASSTQASSSTFANAGSSRSSTPSSRPVSATKSASVSSSRFSRSASSSVSSPSSASCSSKGRENLGATESLHFIEVKKEVRNVFEHADKMIASIKAKTRCSDVPTKVIYVDPTEPGRHYAASFDGTLAEWVKTQPGVFSVKASVKFKTEIVTGKPVNKVTKPLTIRKTPVLENLNTTQALQSRDDPSQSAPWHLQRLTQKGMVEMPEGKDSYDFVFNYNPVGHGEGVRVYVIDTGIRRTHKQFKNAHVEKGWAISLLNSTTNNDPNSGTADLFGHGTEVAAMVVGDTIGVAKKATLVPVKMTNDASTTDVHIITAIRETIEDYKQQHRKGKVPAVINISWSVLNVSNDMSQDPLAKVVKNATDAGIHVVYSAGNNATDRCNKLISDTPAYPLHSLMVGASDPEDNVWIDEDYRYPTGSNFGKCVDIFAPAVDLQVPYLYGPDPDDNGVFSSATSYAAPQVAGVIAILAGKDGPVGFVKPKDMKEQVLKLAVQNGVKNAAQHKDTTARLLQVPPAAAKRKADGIS